MYNQSQLNCCIITTLYYTTCIDSWIRGTYIVLLQARITIKSMSQQNNSYQLQWISMSPCIVYMYVCIYMMIWYRETGSSVYITMSCNIIYCIVLYGHVILYCYCASIEYCPAYLYVTWHIMYCMSMKLSWVMWYDDTSRYIQISSSMDWLI